MASGFTFNRSTQTKWADVSSHELANGSGYTTGGVSLSLSGTVTEDDTNNIAYVKFVNPTWTASG